MSGRKCELTPKARTGERDRAVAPMTGQPDLFAAQREERRSAVAPLPARMRPIHLDEVVGQAHLLSPGAAFRTMVEQGRPISMILWGPPGTGKTTLARLVASESGAAFEQLSATSATVKDVRQILAGARQRLETDERRTVLFLDEIHRFTKNQQDALLPGVEDGTVILIGATTENPFFEVNSPLMSRTTLFRLTALEADDLVALIRRAVADPRGLGGEPGIDPAAVTALAERTGGDARLALNALENAAIVVKGRDGQVISESDIAEALQRRIVRYDKGGDQHYDVISAFIKSMRGSDPDAALFWLHTMLAAGEDPEFIARRMVVFASEDIGLADTTALPIAVAAFHALQIVGLPEASYALTHAAIHLATSRKSNSVKRSMGAARRAVEETPGSTVPAHLRSASYRGARQLGHGEGYRYPHDFPGHIVQQQYLPDDAPTEPIYRPTSEGDEAAVAGRLAEWDRELGRPERR